MLPDATELLLRQAAARLRHDGDQIADAVAERVLASLATAEGRVAGGEPEEALSAGPGGLSTSSTSSTDTPRDRHRRELSTLLERKDSLGPEQLRRVAELTELFDGEQAAHPWWQAATDAGDDLAADVLQDPYGT